MLDRYNRDITYLRISVTDKCNLRCIYCMPKEGIRLKTHAEMLTYEEIEEIVKVAAMLGIKKIRLTGGEPLVKKDLEVLVAKLAAIDGIEQVHMTTNGTLLAPKVSVLQTAGLTGINISLDTLSASRYRAITRGGDIAMVLNGIEAAKAVGLPVKINMVVMSDTADEEMRAMSHFCHERGLELQLINHFSLHAEKSDAYVYERPPSCTGCNRVRLLADGTLKPCLHSDAEYKIDMQDIEASLVRVIQLKPAQGSCCNTRSMPQIGG